MSDISVNWVSVTRSAWRQSLQTGALALTGGAGAAVLLVLLSGSRTIAAAGAVCAAAIGASLGRPTAATSGARWHVGPDGRVSVRWDGAADSAPATAAFVSPFLIALQHGGRTLAIWRDAAPDAAFRRLSAALRWRSPQGRTPDSSDRPDAADRT